MPHDPGSITSAIVGFIRSTGYLGLLVMMALESACTPVPSEIVLPFAGFLVAQGRMDLWVAATVGALGCNLGSLVAYEMGRRGGRGAIRRWGRYVLILPSDIERADKAFARLGGIAVLVGRMLPVVRTYIALPAGMAAMPRLRFHLYTFLGSWPWCLMLVYVGVLLGNRWSTDPTLHALFHRFDLAVAALVVAGTAVFLWRRLAAMRRAARGEGSTSGAHGR